MPCIKGSSRLPSSRAEEGSQGAPGCRLLPRAGGQRSQTTLEAAGVSPTLLNAGWLAGLAQKD